MDRDRRSERERGRGRSGDLSTLAADPRFHESGRGGTVREKHGGPSGLADPARTTQTVSPPSSYSSFLCLWNRLIYSKRIDSSEMVFRLVRFVRVRLMIVEASDTQTATSNPLRSLFPKALPLICHQARILGLNAKCFLKIGGCCLMSIKVCVALIIVLKTANILFQLIFLGYSASFHL
ncbi:uncharacterized protein LOC126585035 [Malus sylvestris]|uniref:uncharacterized protein LOC126585035 n=1 Tax=Malus sylvestris TaxID=3752 RepID=UPI0010AA0843|nr:uncharacterized protein LOC103407555 isoform X1 [Malus domestica]XP_050105389.1 uncharacterized protein LOC126585035 [Malus sylvestris]